ncbi:hypothetical protein [Campylobacter iguaniorum]|uniref:hypothetical protein n=1 Tax=Campylobacter iguaniorum TaxID=1244531 RepID=UPI000ADE9D03|nr:hypothetical protein [Campylobacter iguaniorum]
MKFARILRLNLLSSQNVGVYLLSNLIGDLARQYSPLEDGNYRSKSKISNLAEI